MAAGFDKNTISAYDGRNVNLYFRAEVTCYVLEKPTANAVTCAEHPNLPFCPSHTLVPATRESVLYLDAGLWAGDGRADDWPRFRDFGIVFGGAVAICGFAPRPRQVNEFHESASDDEIRKSPDLQQIQTFLQAFNVPGLGTPRIWQMLSLPNRSEQQLQEQAPPLRDRIYVVIGDLHLPAMDSATVQPLIAEAHRWGRNSLVLPPHPIESHMPVNDRIDWNNSYSGVPGSIGADISQHSISQLADWLDALRIYQASPQGQRLPVHVLQTGDLFDFWIGLDRYFDESAAGEVILQPQAEDFVDYWLDQVLTRISVSADVRRAIDGMRALNGQFMYGNHDNYMRHLPRRAHPSGVRACPASFTDRDSGGGPGTVFAEHGHRVDAVNRDGATGGHGTTQAAFFLPLLRNFENFGRKMSNLFALASTGSSPLPERLTYIKEAAEVGRRTGCGIYVMGHTHQGLVKRILVVPAVAVG
jgi:hypothetical protein